MTNLFSELSENHKRVVSSSLGLFDEALCEIESLAKGQTVRSVLYRRRNRLSPGQRERLLVEIAKCRAILGELKRTLGLREKSEDVGIRIASLSAAFWETLVETESKRLRAYGVLPDGFADYFDPKIQVLVQALLNLADTIHPNPANRVSISERRVGKRE